jgi:hypothetical protein
MRRVPRDAWFAGLAGLLSLLGAVLGLELWRADLGVPLDYFGDVNLQHLLLRDAIEQGWYFQNDRLGAPDGLQLYDYPVLNGDTLSVVVAWVLGHVGFGSAAVMNLLFVLSFPAVGVAAHLVLRRIGAEPWAALVCSVLYAVLPFHFIRGETHLFLSTYFAVPVGAYLALAVLDGERLRTLTAVGLAVLVAVASGSFYYSAFTVLLVVAAAAARALVRRERAPLLAGGLVVGVIVAVSLVQLAPTIVYRIDHGTNDQVAKRFTFESEVYSLKLTQLVLPIDDHRLEPLARVKKRYTDRFPPGDARAAALGITATLGLAWLVAVAIAALFGLRPRGRHPSLAFLTLVAFLFATTGGLGTLFGLVWSQTRAWNRLSIFIAFFALAAVALGLGALGRRLARPAVYAAVLVVVLVGGFLDQTTSSYVPNYQAFKEQWSHDDAFFRSLEATLPSGAMVAQLPYEPFPEPPAGRQSIYEPAKPFLHTGDLRWSYGAMRGRPADWLAAYAERPASEVVTAARDRGFAGILVDRLGYGDDGAAITAELQKQLGAPDAGSPNGRFLYYGL